MVNTGRALEVARKKLGWSARTVAGKLKISHVHVREIEKGTKLPSVDLLQKWNLLVWPEGWARSKQDYSAMTVVEKHIDGVTVEQVMKEAGWPSKKNVAQTMRRLVRRGDVVAVTVYRVAEWRKQ